MNIHEGVWSHTWERQQGLMGRVGDFNIVISLGKCSRVNIYLLP